MSFSRSSRRNHRWPQQRPSGRSRQCGQKRGGRFLRRRQPNVPNTAFRGDPKATERQLARLAQVKASRNRAAVEAALAEVDRATGEGANVVPSVLKAVRAYATVGEIVELWRKRFGAFTPSTDF